MFSIVYVLANFHVESCGAYMRTLIHSVHLPYVTLHILYIFTIIKKHKECEFLKNI